MSRGWRPRYWTAPADDRPLPPGPLRRERPPRAIEPDIWHRAAARQRPVLGPAATVQSRTISSAESRRVRARICRSACCACPRSGTSPPLVPPRLGPTDWCLKADPHARAPHRLPDALAGRRHVEAFDPERRERVDHGVDDRRQRADRAGLARALGAQWVALGRHRVRGRSPYTGIVSARGIA